jgi:hypothetical protein
MLHRGSAHLAPIIPVGVLPSPAQPSALSLPALQAPGLAVVLVGQRKDSQTYVRNKKKACEEVGIVSFGTDLDESATEEEVLQVGGEAGWVDGWGGS